MNEKENEKNYEEMLEGIRGMHNDDFFQEMVLAKETVEKERMEE